MVYKHDVVKELENFMHGATVSKRMHLLRKSGMDIETAKAYSKPYRGSFYIPVMNSLRILKMIRMERRHKLESIKNIIAKSYKKPVVLGKKYAWHNWD